MPHDVNGKIVEVGSNVRILGGYWKGRIGTVSKVHPGATACDVEVAVIVPTFSVSMQTGTAAKEIEVID